MGVNDMQTSQQGMGMATNNDPDENDVLDLVMARHQVASIFARDGFDAEEEAALAALDAPINHVAHRVKLWGALLSLMRNSLTRHTGDKAKDAEVTIVIDRYREVADIIERVPEMATA
jgi:hypothetical protein